MWFRSLLNPLKSRPSVGGAWRSSRRLTGRLQVEGLEDRSVRHAGLCPGETTKTITNELKVDSKRVADEYFYLDLFGNSGNSLFTKKRGLGTILNDD